MASKFDYKLLLEVGLLNDIDDIELEADFQIAALEVNIILIFVFELLSISIH